MKVFRIDQFKCTLCSNWFNPPFNLPYRLKCTHSICTVCVEKSIESKNTSIICPEDLELNQLKEITVNQTTKKALERLLREHKNFNQTNHLQCINSLAVKFDEMLESKQIELKNLSTLIDQIFENETKRLRELYEKAKMEVSRPYRIVNEWKDVVRTNIKKWKASRKDQQSGINGKEKSSNFITKELNHYIEQGRKIKFDLNEYMKCDFKQLIQILLLDPQICFRHGFSIFDSFNSLEQSKARENDKKLLRGMIKCHNCMKTNSIEQNMTINLNNNNLFDNLQPQDQVFNKITTCKKVSAPTLNAESRLYQQVVDCNRQMQYEEGSKDDLTALNGQNLQNHQNQTPTKPLSELIFSSSNRQPKNTSSAKGGEYRQQNSNSSSSSRLDSSFNRRLRNIPKVYDNSNSRRKSSSKSKNHNFQNVESGVGSKPQQKSKENQQQQQPQIQQTLQSPLKTGCASSSSSSSYNNSIRDKIRKLKESQQVKYLQKQQNIQKQLHPQHPQHPQQHGYYPQHNLINSLQYSPDPLHIQIPQQTNNLYQQPNPNSSQNFLLDSQIKDYNNDNTDGQYNCNKTVNNVNVDNDDDNDDDGYNNLVQDQQNEQQSPLPLLVPNCHSDQLLLNQDDIGDGNEVNNQQENVDSNIDVNDNTAEENTATRDSFASCKTIKLKRMSLQYQNHNHLTQQQRQRQKQQHKQKQQQKSRQRTSLMPKLSSQTSSFKKDRTSSSSSAFKKGNLNCRVSRDMSQNKSNKKSHRNSYSKSKSKQKAQATFNIAYNNTNHQVPNFNFLKEWQVEGSAKQPDNKIQVVQRVGYNCEEEKTKYVKKIEQLRCQQLLGQTQVGPNYIELVGSSLSDANMALYLSQLDWTNIQIIKMIRTGLSDGQMNELLNFVLHSKVHTLMLSFNSLTELSLDGLLNFVEMKQPVQVKNVYLPKNNISLLKGQSRAKINLLKEKGINLYI